MQLKRSDLQNVVEISVSVGNKIIITRIRIQIQPNPNKLAKNVEIMKKNFC